MLTTTLPQFMIVGQVCGPDVQADNPKHVGLAMDLTPNPEPSHDLPGKPLYALKQRLVSSTITAPPICMSSPDIRSHCCMAKQLQNWRC